MTRHTLAQPAASAESGSGIPTASAYEEFARMTYDEQVDAIRSLARGGMSDHEVANRTKLHVEQVRRLLAVHADDAAEAHAARWQEQR